MGEQDGAVTPAAFLRLRIGNKAETVHNSAAEDVIHLFCEVRFARIIPEARVFRAHFEETILKELLVVAGPVALYDFGEIFNERRSAKKNPRITAVGERPQFIYSVPEIMLNVHNSV